MRSINSINYREKMITLWIVFLLGTLFHTQLALIPLFHGIDVAIMSHMHQEAATMSEIRPILWGMFLFFTVPLLAIAAIAFNQSNRFRKFHFGLTLFYSALNFIHLLADLMVDTVLWYQIFLMLLLLIIGVLLNIVAFQWIQSDVRHSKPKIVSH